MTVEPVTVLAADGSRGPQPLFEEARCLGCGSEGLFLLLRNGADPFLAALRASDQASEGVPRESRWVVCRTCGLVRQNPRPTAVATARLYRGSFWTRPVEVYAQQGARMFRSQFAWIISTAPLKRSPQGGMPRVLDIGSTTGKLLDHFRAAGWETYGVEPDPSYAAYAARCGHRIEAGLFSDGVFPGVRFDLITASHVFEHIADPLTFLRAVAVRLKPKGGVFLEVPSVKWPTRDLLAGVFVSPHYYVYSERTLARVLARSGFRVEHWAICGRGLRVIAAPGSTTSRSVALRDSAPFIVALTVFHRYLRCPTLRAGLAAWLCVTRATRFLLRALLGPAGSILYTSLRRRFYR